MSDYPPTEWLEEPGFYPVTIKSMKMKYGDEAKPPWADTSVSVFAVTDNELAASVPIEISPLKFSDGERPTWVVDRLNENLEALGIDLKFDNENYDPQDAIVKMNEMAELAVGNKSMLKISLNNNGYKQYKFTKLISKTNTQPAAASTNDDEPISTDEVAKAFNAEVF